MPLLRINATASGLTCDAPSSSLSHAIASHSRSDAPAVIMVHGYKYAPNSDQHCPHRKIFALRKNGWPTQLGFGAQSDDAGLGIALGWYARGPLRQVHARAQTLGAEIAHVVSILRDQKPDRPVHLIAHSLGAEAALSALPHLPAASIDRIVLLTGASLRSRASQQLATPAGRTAEVLNMTSRENDLFDAAFERLMRAHCDGDRAIGQGIAAPNVATLQLDCPETLRALHRLGFMIDPPQRRICHWSAYTRPGVMGFYRSFLRDPQAVPFAALLARLPRETAPRWSALTSRLPLASRLRNALSPLSDPLSWSAMSDGIGRLRRAPHDTAC